MADSGGSDGDERVHVGGDGDGFIKDNVTGEEIDQNALQDSQEQISFDQFNTFPGTTQQTTPNDLFNPADVNQLINQQALQALAQQQALAQLAAQQQHLQQQQGSNGNGSSLSNNQNAAQQLLAAQLAQLQAAQLAQLGWGNQELASLYNPLQSMTGLNPLASLGLGGNDLYQNPLLNPLMNHNNLKPNQGHRQPKGGGGHIQRPGQKKGPKKKSGGAFGMGSIENQLMDIIKLQSGTAPDPMNAGNNAPGAVGQGDGSVTGDDDRYSRKVFVGGLPPDIDEDEITASFRKFGPLCVDWPHKNESKSYFPPKGYAFLLFQDEISVHQLVEVCVKEDDKLFTTISSPTIKDKSVQIRPWNISDSDFVMDGSAPLDPRKTIFVGGVPRPLRAIELAIIMDRLYGSVCYAGIDTDPELKYPKGAGRVAFSSQQSYIAAISARFVQLQHGDIDKRVEVKPYVLDDQMCDECSGSRCSGKFAPFFCANVTCLQYYCETCWSTIHSRPGREFHKPLVKESTYSRNSSRVQNPMNTLIPQ